MTAQLSFFAAVDERDRILRAFQENHKQYVEALRAFARDIGRRDGQVDIDAVRFEMEHRSFPMPAEVGIDERIFGVVFRCKDFIPISQRPTVRRERVARAGLGASYITVYRVV